LQNTPYTVVFAIIIAFYFQCQPYTMEIAIIPSRIKAAENVTVNHQFSSKPVVIGAFPNYYDKMTAYANILTSHAEALEPGVKAQTFPPIPTSEDESIFQYLDTATSRAGIGAINAKLELGKVAIVGVGGTGAYVLDLVSKTPVKEIHLFDGDFFLNHNAFRAPGAASLEELNARPKKVAYLKERYSKMHRGIVSHDRYGTVSPKLPVSH